MWRDLVPTKCHAVLYQQIGAEHHTTVGRFSTAAERQLFTRDQQQSLMQRILSVNRFLHCPLNDINERHSRKMQSKKSPMLCRAYEIMCMMCCVGGQSSVSQMNFLLHDSIWLQNMVCHHFAQRCQCDLRKTRNTPRLKCCACPEKWSWPRPKRTCHDTRNACSKNVAKVLRLPRKTICHASPNTSACHEVPLLP